MFQPLQYRGVDIRPATHVLTCGMCGGCKPSPTIGGEKKATLEEVMAYDNPSVEEKIMEDMQCPRECAKQIFDDVKRFLWMGASNPNVVPTPVIDEGWHVFVLHTEAYAEFCEKYFKGFLHHLPMKVDISNFEKVMDDYLKPSIDAMHSAFGTMPSKYWAFRTIGSFQEFHDREFGPVEYHG